MTSFSFRSLLKVPRFYDSAAAVEVLFLLHGRLHLLKCSRRHSWNINWGLSCFTSVSWSLQVLWIFHFFAIPHFSCLAGSLKMEPGSCYTTNTITIQNNNDTKNVFLISAMRILSHRSAKSLNIQMPFLRIGKTVALLACMFTGRALTN